MPSLALHSRDRATFSLTVPWLTAVHLVMRSDLLCLVLQSGDGGRMMEGQGFQDEDDDGIIAELQEMGNRATDLAADDIARQNQVGTSLLCMITRSRCGSANTPGHC